MEWEVGVDEADWFDTIDCDHGSDEMASSHAVSDSPRIPTYPPVLSCRMVLYYDLMPTPRLVVLWVIHHKSEQLGGLKKPKYLDFHPLKRYIKLSKLTSLGFPRFTCFCERFYKLYYVPSCYCSHSGRESVKMRRLVRDSKREKEDQASNENHSRAAPAAVKRSPRIVSIEPKQIKKKQWSKKKSVSWER